MAIDIKKALKTIIRNSFRQKVIKIKESLIGSNEFDDVMFPIVIVFFKATPALNL